MGDRLSGKVAVVTGSGHGIGQAIAVRFAEEGARVVVNDIAADRVEETLSIITGAGGTAVAGVADISKSDEIAAMFDTATDHYGPVEVLVNNAGLVSPMLHFFNADEAWWRKIIDVNLTGTFLCCHAGAKIMAKNGGGSIINMSSGGATRAHRAFTAYDASKGGIEALTRALALDLGPYNVRVNALMPGSIDTEGLDLEGRKLRGENVPLERIGEPADMAGPAVFLASDDSAYVTGDVLRVDGGMLAQQRSATVDIQPPSCFPTIAEIQ